VEISLKLPMIAMIYTMKNLLKGLLKIFQMQVAYITKLVMNGMHRFQDMRKKPSLAQLKTRQVKPLNLKDPSHQAKEETRRRQHKLLRKMTNLRRIALRKRRIRNRKNLQRIKPKNPKRSHLAKDKRSNSQRF